MFLTDLMEELRAGGATDEELGTVKASIFHDFPAIAHAVMNQPLSTAQPDPDVPDSYVAELMERLV
jgi:hypothetical protein